MRLEIATRECSAIPFPPFARKQLYEEIFPFGAGVAGTDCSGTDRIQGRREEINWAFRGITEAYRIWKNKARRSKILHVERIKAANQSV